jgi:MFS family permease
VTLVQLVDVLTLRLYDGGLGPWSITGLLLCAALPVVVLARPAGRLVDTAPFRKLAVTAALWQAACCVGLAFDVPLAVTFALVLLLQAGQAVANPTWQALVPDIADQDEVGRVVSASQAMTTTASVAAPAVAGLTVALVGYGAPLIVDAVTFVVLGFAGALVRTGRRTPETAAGEEQDVAAAPYSLRSDPLLWPLLLGVCALVLVGEVTNVVEVFLVRGVLGAGTAAFGFVAALLFGGIVIGSLLAARAGSQAARARRALLAAVALGALLVVAGSAPVLWIFAAAWALLGVANGAVNVDVGTLLLERAPERSRGRVLATVNGMTRGSSLGAMALGGAAGSLLGARATFVLSGALMAAIGVVLLVRIVRIAPGPQVAGEAVGSQ